MLYFEISIRNLFFMKTHEQSTIAFALACPTLLTSEKCADPYKIIEQFFSFTKLGGYRAELTQWFRNALYEGVKYKKASDMLFIHDQFLLLLNAGFVIATNGLKYTPVPDPDGGLFCEWLVQSSYIKNKDCVEYFEYNTPYWLEVRDRDAPLEYIQKTLTIKTVTYLRKGLYEWREASSSKHLSIVHLESKYIFEMYELLQRLVEACYLVLVAEVALNRK